MTDHTPLPPAAADQGQRPRRKWPFVAAAVVAVGLTGAAATAFSQQGPWGRPGLVNIAFDPAQAEDRADRAIRHLAVEADATPEQQDKLRAIARAAVHDLIPMREKAVAARERAHTLLTQPTIDRTAIEALRTEQIALADAASRRLVQAITDAAETLTPDQRRKLDDRIHAHRGFWGWRRG
jgi:periplasmic protein CpxP/Spy